mgnify:CR=1 FL=1|tara:strand:- start:3598 stop:4653 length:1056 start_codon:yes stop_codon:yes gene_type:complete
MNFQSLVKKVGFGNKSYFMLPTLSNESSVLISGHSFDNTKIVQRIEKITSRPVKHIRIGEERRFPNKIPEISTKIYKDNIRLVFVVGGGTIIDFAKIIYQRLKYLNKNHKMELYILPSRIGSGAECSITSIINTKNGKVVNVNHDFLPDGVIYDFDLFKNLNSKEIYLGSIDALCHCLESMTSRNKNPYLNYFSINAIKYFLDKINNHEIDTKNIMPKELLVEYSILSFNGGIAQNNAGSGICHALSHSVEEMTGFKHAECICLFFMPLIHYLSKIDDGLQIIINDELLNYIFKVRKNALEKNKITHFKELFSDKNIINSIVNNSMDDPCWRLFFKKINITDLKEYLYKNL